MLIKLLKSNDELYSTTVSVYLGQLYYPPNSLVFSLEFPCLLHHCAKQLLDVWVSNGYQLV